MKFVVDSMILLLIAFSTASSQITVAESTYALARADRYSIYNAVDRYGIYELTIGHDDAPYNNPWEDVSVSVRFTHAVPRSDVALSRQSDDFAGEVITIDGFYYNTDLWKVRFSPPAVGLWTWMMTFFTPTDTLTTSGFFNCEPSARPGFVYRHPTNPFRLIFENGSLFNAIGLFNCILDGDSSGTPLDDWGFDGGFRPKGQHEGWTVDMPTYMAAYGDSGAGFNLFRWSVDNCTFKLWDTISIDGNRYLVQEGIWGDELVEALRQYGFRIWMTIFGFDPAYPNAADDPQEQEAVEHYIRYIMARYGAYVDIWELMNEATVSHAWISFAADYLRSIDPYDRLITTSWERPELPEIDINAPHWYERESEFDSDLRTSQVISYQKVWSKPVIFGEQGNAIQNWDERSALRMRLRSWTAFFEEGVLIFANTSFAKDYYDSLAANLYIGPEERGYIRILQDFTAGADADAEQLTLSPTNHHIRAYGLQSPLMVLGYFHHFSDHDSPETTSVTIDLPTSSTVIWLDPATGDTLQNLFISGGIQTLTTPEFVVDLALKIRFDTADTATDIEDEPVLPHLLKIVK